MHTSSRFALLGASILSVVIAGCGSSDSSPSPARIDKASTRNVTQSTFQAMQNLVAPPAGSTAGGTNAGIALGNAVQGMQTVAQPQNNNGTATQSAPLDFTVGLADTPPGATGTCNCGATSCTFQACSVNGVTIDGTLSWGGGRVQAQGMTYKVHFASANVTTDTTMKLDCDLTVTPTQMNGSMHTGGDATVVANGKTVTANWDIGMKLNNVAFSGTGQPPTGGSAHVDASVSASGNGSSASYAGSADVTFP